MRLPSTVTAPLVTDCEDLTAWGVWPLGCAAEAGGFWGALWPARAGTAASTKARPAMGTSIFFTVFSCVVNPARAGPEDSPDKLRAGKDARSVGRDPASCFTVLQHKPPVKAS